MTGKVLPELTVLAERARIAWEQARAAAPRVVVEPGVPVLYFGDAEGYAASRPRVVTVGLNPSNAEFPRDAPFQRLPGAQALFERNIDAYLASLNRYFKVSPYRSWFGAFEPILGGMGASYYPGGHAAALHTDLCSPVATDPTWSRLEPSFQHRLIADGRPLWHDLIRILRPDVLLVSVARKHLGSIEFETVEELGEIYRLDAERKVPYPVKAWRIQIAPQAKPLVVFGQAAHRPFGTVGQADKQRIGRRVLQAIDKLCFLQFPHPGGEHRPDRDDWKDWNVKDHARKFMRIPGRWRTSADLNAGEQEGEVVFWGEWEAPSQVIARYDRRAKGLPRYLHVPFWQRPPDDGFLQNTDPYVFGERFLYSNCRQTLRGRPRRTQRLAVGSLILFGSSLTNEFVIDTVFVVADAQPMSVAVIDDLDGVDHVFKSVVCEVLYRGDNREHRNRLYSGATPRNPVGQMFSFFPCLPAGDAPHGFPRPSVRLDGLINPDSWQMYKITGIDSLEKIERLWLRIVQAVLDRGLYLGVHAGTPTEAPGTERPTASSRRRC